MGDTSRHSPYLHRQKKLKPVVRRKESQPAANEDGEMKAEPLVTQPETQMAVRMWSHATTCVRHRAPPTVTLLPFVCLRLPALAYDACDSQDVK